ncbi:MAG: DUF4115 domain-containing protein [Candidatus Omnitrophica bacterium]|nr:DUF4115 domain-containing protein [Candidatus Omnitrophota bacterium]
MSDNPTDVGILLKQERERKGISLDVVHESTKVPMDALKAIEEGYKVRTLTAFYYKSFVKIYAQYLGMDANHIVSLIPTHHPKPVVSSYPLRRDPAARPAAATGTGAHRVEGVRRSWNLLAQPMILKKKKKVFKVAALIVAVVLGTFLVSILVRHVIKSVKVNHAMNVATSKNTSKFVVKRNGSPAKFAEVKPSAPKTAQAKAPEVKVTAAKVLIPKAAEVFVEKAVEKKIEEKPAQAVVATPVGKQVTITVRAQVTTWIRVDVDNTGTAFQGRLKKGSSGTWRGTKKIVLSANDIGTLDFEVNGRSVGKLARNYLKAKKVVVTPEGLTVEK